MAGNQTRTMGAKAATNNTARCSLRFKVTPEASIAVNPSRKRRPEMSIDDDQRWKRQKMDCNVRAECSQLLKGLMDRRLARAFTSPVDPMRTPRDYFKMIKHPMDLGTIKRKLERNVYSAPYQFADDMVLTFANAMSYHPPSSEVYRCARVLDCNFRRRWEILAAKLKLVVENSHQVMKPTIGLFKAPIAEKRGNSRRVALEKKLKLGRWIKNYDKTRIEEQLEAAKMASRERERNAARMALEKIKTVEIDSPPNLLREMDVLFGCYSNPKSLEKIGFYLKQNYEEEDEVYEKEC